MASFSTPIRARSNAERRQAFFYAETEADLYDAAADLNTPLFSLMQQTLMELVRRHIDIHTPSNIDPFAVLDIGSGTGSEALPLLKAYPSSHLVAFDLCEPMHAIFRGKAAQELGDAAVRNRCQFLTGDIATETGSVETLRRPLAGWGLEPRYEIVISSLTLHHLTTDEKRLVYHRIAEVLGPGGLFVNADIFSYASPTMASAATSFGLDWIRKNFTEPLPHLQAQQEALGERAASMMESWIDHYVNYNLPDLLDSAVRNDDGTARLRDQTQMLLDAGFVEVACPFRYWEVGILWGLKA